MKTIFLLIFPFVLIAGGLILFHSASALLTPATVQVITATYGPPLGFFPTQLTVKTGQPVRLEVSGIFEFTPQTPGKYPISCAMGIPHGFIVVE